MVVVAAIAYTLLVAVPTDLVDTPVFGREVPPTWWSWPALVVSSVLAALLTLGSTGAMVWFEPVRPLLQLAALGLLVWALRVRLRGELACAVR